MKDINGIIDACRTVKVMVHDDSCGEYLTKSGKCPKCNFYPDMQSTAFTMIDYDELRDLICKGRTLLGIHRNPIGGALEDE
jgi:hypothetical protein